MKIARTENKEQTYKLLGKKLKSLIGSEYNAVANMANFSALLFNGLDKINWLGFYILKDNQLVLGPFQGKPACIRIEIGKGVCGTSALKKETLIVGDVCKFPGHIVCDPCSRSEIVIPVISGGKLVSVLDIDSPVLNRFDDTDKKYLTKLVDILVECTHF